MGDSDHSLTQNASDSYKKSPHSVYEEPEEVFTPEEYFTSHRDYIEHFYKTEHDTRMVRLEAMKIARDLLPTGTEPKKVLEVSETFENYINNGSKER